MTRPIHIFRASYDAWFLWDMCSKHASDHLVVQRHDVESTHSTKRATETVILEYK
jgi:hypothetical protein